jgi:hypothetical protein
MKPNPLLMLSMLAVLAGGCASDFVPTSPDRYYYPDLHNHVISNRDGQENGAVPRGSPAVAAAVLASSTRREEKPCAGALKDGMDGSKIIDAVDFENARFCCFSAPRQ